MRGPDEDDDKGDDEEEEDTAFREEKGNDDAGNGVGTDTETLFAIISLVSAAYLSKKLVF